MRYAFAGFDIHALLFPLRQATASSPASITAEAVASRSAAAVRPARSRCNPSEASGQMKKFAKTVSD